MMLHYSSEQRRVCVRLSSFWQFSPIFLLYEGAVCMLTTEFFESDCLLTFELLLSYRELSQIRNIFFLYFPPVTEVFVLCNNTIQVYKWPKYRRKGKWKICSCTLLEKIRNYM